MTDAFETLVAQTDPNAHNTLANVGNNPVAIAALRSRAPQIEIHTLSVSHTAAPQYGPCEAPGHPTHDIVESLSWTNGVGGYYSRNDLHGICNPATQTAGFTNYQEAISWGAVGGTNTDGCFSFRIDDGPWSPGCTNEDGVFPPPPTGAPWKHVQREYDFQLSQNPNLVIHVNETWETKVRLITGGPSIRSRWLWAVGTVAGLLGICLLWTWLRNQRLQKTGDAQRQQTPSLPHFGSFPLTYPALIRFVARLASDPAAQTQPQIIACQTDLHCYFPRPLLL